MASACTVIRSLRLSARSAIVPAHAPSTRTGRNWQAVRMPRAMPESVSCRTSSVWATIVSHVPVCEISWPPKNSLKLRTFSELNVSSEKPLEALPHDATVPARRSSTSSAAARRARSSGVELGDAHGEEGVLAGPGRGEHGLAGRGRSGQHAATVDGIDAALDQAEDLEPLDDLRHARRRDVLGVGEGAERQWAFAADGGEGGDLRRGEPEVGLLAQDAGQAVGAQTEAGGDLGAVQRRNRGGDRRGR